MNRTIREEKIANSLIQYEYDEDNDKVLLVVKYDDNNTIKEDTLITMTLDEYINELDRIVKFNVNDSAIAIFQKESFDCYNKYTLSDCYDLNNHCFSTTDSLDKDYKTKFPNNKVNTYLVGQKKR